MRTTTRGYSMDGDGPRLPGFDDVARWWDEAAARSLIAAREAARMIARYNREAAAEEGHPDPDREYVADCRSIVADARRSLAQWIACVRLERAKAAGIRAEPAAKVAEPS